MSAVLVVASLAGCASPAGPSGVPDGEFSELSLAESKSPAQLLRNVAGLRIPDAMVQSIGAPTDESIPCLSKSDDPEGYIRRWQSMVDVQLQPTAVHNTQTIVDGVVSSFVDEGWRAQRMAGTAENNIGHLLINENAGAALIDAAQLQLEGIVTDASSGHIHVVGLGPCVVTDGAGSELVEELEGIEE